MLGDSAGSPEALVQPSSTLPLPFEAHAGLGSLLAPARGCTEGAVAEAAKCRAPEELAARVPQVTGHAWPAPLCACAAPCAAAGSCPVSPFRLLLPRAALGGQPGSQRCGRQGQGSGLARLSAPMAAWLREVCCLLSTECGVGARRAVKCCSGPCDFLPASGWCSSHPRGDRRAGVMVAPQGARAVHCGQPCLSLEPAVPLIPGPHLHGQVPLGRHTHILG